MIVISACLCGVNCKYNGKNNLNEEILKFLQEGRAVLICPEQMGGLETPRIPHEICGGDGGDVLDEKTKVINPKGGDSSLQFIKGAHESLNIAKKVGAKVAILKAKSPSCGCGEIYDGNFSATKIKGNGVTAELFLRNGIKVYTEKNFHSLK
ncbi:DUF523 domain-containing protein [Clostridium aestuarii]|uniref:DUF523 domain-containing protein n=1 Tax=Clostridium aestuarii TaxID=338193 RepID=A0ABT4D045_9CLOT|nr:DUF523 domain-containing protein [Clostridium aestuarii]MCY6483550.1 DUF523 domain-containing protein [Clostridium aestuarii]